MSFPRFGSMTALALALPLIAAMGCGSSTQKPAASAADGDGAHTGPAEVGHRAPDLSIQTVNGKGKVALDKWAGKVVVVDFWATWCGPCKESFPALQEIAKRHAGEVEVVGVSVNDEPEGIAAFAKELGTTFPIGWDEGHSIAERWKPASMPSSFILDGSGKVRFTHVGYHPGDEAEIERELATLLGKSAPVEKKPEAKPTPAPPPEEQAATPVANSAPTAVAAANPPPKPLKKRGAQPVKKKKKK